MNKIHQSIGTAHISEYVFLIFSFLSDRTWAPDADFSFSRLLSLWFFLTHPFRHDQLSSSSFHLIITSLLDKDAHKSGELFDSGRMELFVTSPLKDMSQIQTRSDFLSRTTLTRRKCFPPLFWFEVKEVMRRKNIL